MEAMKAPPKGQRGPRGGGPHPRQVEPISDSTISMQILTTKPAFQLSRGGSPERYAGRRHCGDPHPLGNYITEMMEPASTEGEKIQAAESWTLAGQSGIIPEVDLVTLHLLEPRFFYRIIHFAIEAGGDGGGEGGGGLQSYLVRFLGLEVRAI